MLLFITILALINSFPLRANIFVLAVEIVRLYAEAALDNSYRSFWRESSDAVIIT
jgi:hypothetical protein